jgi:hypothetical protein
MKDVHPITISSPIASMIGFSEMSEVEKDIFLNKVGAILLESATLRYLGGLSPSQREVFEEWLEAHAEEETLLEELCASYQEFSEILSEEIMNFNTEVVQMV